MPSAAHTPDIRLAPRYLYPKGGHASPFCFGPAGGVCRDAPGRSTHVHSKRPRLRRRPNLPRASVLIVDGKIQGRPGPRASCRRAGRNAAGKTLLPSLSMPTATFYRPLSSRPPSPSASAPTSTCSLSTPWPPPCAPSSRQGPRPHRCAFRRHARHRRRWPRHRIWRPHPHARRTQGARRSSCAHRRRLRLHQADQGRCSSFGFRRPTLDGGSLTRHHCSPARKYRRHFRMLRHQFLRQFHAARKIVPAVQHHRPHRLAPPPPGRSTKPLARSVMLP